MVQIPITREFFVSRLPSIGKAYVDDWFHIHQVTHGFLLRPKRGDLLLHVEEEKTHTVETIITKYILIDTKNRELIQFEHRQTKNNSETTLEITHWEINAQFNPSQKTNDEVLSPLVKQNRDAPFW